MKIDYDDEELRLLIECGKSTDKRYKKLKSNGTFRKDLDMVMSLLNAASSTKELAFFAKLHYESLKYEFSGYSSVRIGFTTKYRLIFQEFDGGIRINLIEISEHYGDK